MENFLAYLQALQDDCDIPAWSGYMPNKKLDEQLRFFDLHPVLRALLIADGTVTMAIEAIYREPIDVVVKHQESIVLAKPIAIFDLNAGQEVYYRAVELNGKLTGKHYVNAYSLLRPEAIREDLWRELTENRIGMGAVMRNASQGNFRQVIHFGSGNVTQVNKSIKTANDYVHRTYLVSMEDKPAIVITEVFDVASFISGYK